MGLSAMYPFIGLTKRTYILLNTLHKAEGKTLLTLAGMTTDRTKLTDTGQLQVQRGDILCM